jgi:hypothetical protein
MPPPQANHLYHLVDTRNDALGKAPDWVTYVQIAG